MPAPKRATRTVKKAAAPAEAARKKAPASRAGGTARVKPPAPLTESARMTYGMTFHGKNSYGEFWVKFDANDAIREGETPRDAYIRLSDFVEDTIIAKIEDLGAA